MFKKSISNNIFKRNNGLIIISGSSKGIGKTFVETISNKLKHNNSNCKIIAIARSDIILPKDIIKNDNVDCFKVDLSNIESINNFKIKVSKNYENEKVNLLLNVAGMLEYNNNGPEKSIRKLNYEYTTELFKLNTFAPMFLTSAFNNELISKDKGNKNFVINISARVGSINDNRLGGWYSYRMSKAALNQFMKTLSIEYKNKNILTMNLHPNTVQTSLSKNFTRNIDKKHIYTTQQSVDDMLDLIEHMQEENTGNFYDYAGKLIEF